MHEFNLKLTLWVYCGTICCSYCIHTHAHTSFGYWVRYSDSAFIQIEQALDQKLDDKARSNWSRSNDHLFGPTREHLLLIVLVSFFPASFSSSLSLWNLKGILSVSSINWFNETNQREFNDATGFNNVNPIEGKRFKKKDESLVELSTLVELAKVKSCHFHPIIKIQLFLVKFFPKLSQK